MNKHIERDIIDGIQTCISPCKGLCVGDYVCNGCGRTDEEKRDWGGYSDERKLEVLRRIENEQERGEQEDGCHG